MSSGTILLFITIFMLKMFENKTIYKNRYNYSLKKFRVAISLKILKNLSLNST